MANLRSVNTKFWDDPWIESLTVSEKLLFLYLITNSYANLVGIYEITIKRICFETGIDRGTISKGLERFAKDKKAYFVEDSYMVLPNWLKNQNLNTNMKKGVVKIVSELPNSVKESILGNGYQTIQNDYQTLRNTLLKYEVEVLEDEVEIEEEVYRKFAHLKLSIIDYESIIKDGYSKDQVDYILDAIENFKKNTNYISLNLTCRKWLKKEYPKKQDNGNNKQQEVGKDRFKIITHKASASK